MTAIMTVVSAVVFSQSSGTVPDEDNLLKNPEFKTDAAGKILNWNSYASPEVKDGTLTIKVTTIQPWNKNIQWGGINQSIKLPAGGTFKLSFDATIKNVDTILIRVISMDLKTKENRKAAEKILSAKEFVNNSKKIEWTFTLPEPCKFFTLYIDFMAKASETGSEAQLKNVKLSVVQ